MLYPRDLRVRYSLFCPGRMYLRPRNIIFLALIAFNEIAEKAVECPFLLIKSILARPLACGVIREPRRWLS